MEAMCMQETKRQFTESDVRLYNRSTIEIDGVDEVLGFDENVISLCVCGKRAVIEGEALKITLLSVQEGRISANGKINGIFYEDEAKPKRTLMGRLFGSRE